MSGRSQAELPGAGERGDKGSRPGMRGGERFYSQGRRPSQVFPYKEESAAVGVQGRLVSVPDWTRLQGVGPRKFSQPPELVCGIFPGHDSACPTFQVVIF